MTTDNRTEVKTALQNAAITAATPLIIEALGLLSDAVRELRAQMQDDAILRRECAPLERKLRLKRIGAELEDFDAEREEAIAERAERAAERNTLALEREAREEHLRADRADRADRAEERAATRAERAAKYAAERADYNVVDGGLKKAWANGHATTT